MVEVRKCMTKLAIVIPWFGKDIQGGAEQQAWQIASRLATKGIDITVLTTCSRSFHDDWGKNHHKPGQYLEGNFSILRFKVKRRNTHRFNRVVDKLLNIDKKSLVPGISPISSEEEKTYVDENINSPELIAYLKRHSNYYDFFLFMPYLFPHAIKGIPEIHEKAILQPCLHNECYAYLTAVRNSIYAAQHIFFNSKGEQLLAQKLFGPQILAKSTVIGEGVEIGEGIKISEDAETVKDIKILSSQLDVIDEKYLLCLGKRCKEKNTHTLINEFVQFLQNNHTDLKLVLAGPSTLPVPTNNRQIIDLGLVSHEEKVNLLKNCLALINPSINESFSRVIFEAWFNKKPVIIPQDCLATYQSFLDSNQAGFTYCSQEPLNQILTQIDKTSPEVMMELGQKGYNYAKLIANWDTICQKYMAQLEIMKNSQIDVNASSKKIVLMGETVVDNDAVGNDVIQQLNLFRQNNIQTHLYAHTYSKTLKPFYIRKKSLKKLLQDSNSIVIYHHSTYWDEIFDLLDGTKCKSYLRYHNVTPPEFYQQYVNDYYIATYKGRKQTKELVQSGLFTRYLSCSTYNSGELIEYGANREKIQILAPFHKINEFDHAKINKKLAKKFEDNVLHVLFIGRIAPNKGHKHIIKVINEYVNHYDHKIKMHIIGHFDPRLEKYMGEIKSLIDKYHLWDNILFHLQTNFNELHTFYQHADIFLLMSEHEGFCLPIIEAQYHHLPVIAMNMAAVGDTMGEDQVTLNQMDHKLFASAIHVVASNKQYRYFLTQKGFHNYLKYEKYSLERSLLNCIHS